MTNSGFRAALKGSLGEERVAKPGASRYRLHGTSRRRVSTAMMQRFCKPKAGGSNPSPGIRAGKERLVFNCLLILLKLGRRVYARHMRH
jgi:hypothetical protein